MLPLAPPRLSTSTVWPSTLPRLSATMRAEVSTSPPGGLGTMSVTGLPGYACAKAQPAAHASAAATMAWRRKGRRFIVGSSGDSTRLHDAAAFQRGDLFFAQSHFTQHRVGVLPERRRIALLAARCARQLRHDARDGQ